MPLNLAQVQAQDDAWGKQYDAQQEQQAEQQKPNAAEVLPTSVFHWMNQSGLGRATLSGIDTAVSTADSMYNSQPMRKVRDAAAGAITGAVNIADAGHSLVKATEQNFADLANPESMPGNRGPASVMNAPSPIWDHAKNAILDFRDAVAVQDPTLADNLVQGVAQLALPFAGYSRMLGGLHGVADAVASGALTDSTALGPHDPRLADMIALGRHTEGKLGEALRTLAPDGSALNGYINFLTDRTNETEAEGRFKNVLDGFGANLIATPLIHGAAVVLKQGTAGLRAALEGGASKVSDLVPAPSPGDTASLQATEVPTAPLGADRTAIDDPASIKSLNDSPAVDAFHMTLKANAGNPTPAANLISPLVKHLPDTPEGAFYKDILGRLDQQKLNVPVTTFGSYFDKDGAQVAKLNVAGNYTPTNGGGRIHLYPGAFRDPATLVHTFTHEAVHAATFDQIANTKFVRQAVEKLRTAGKARVSTETGEAYGFKNPQEFAAEIESNPEFQKQMHNVKLDDGRSVWDHYRKAMAGILGLGGVAAASPMFDQLLSAPSQEKNGA